MTVDREKHRRRSGWTSGGRMASAAGGSMPSGVGDASGVRCGAPAENGFWRI